MNKDDTIISLLRGIEQHVGTALLPITHSELLKLRDLGQLVPGQQYRITDYVATTSDPESRSANHPFDIIVTADNSFTLNENARAIKHKGDTYFDFCQLQSWKLKYCIDNDMNRFIQAVPSINGYVVFMDGLNIVCRLISDTDNTIEGFPYKLKGELQGIPMYLYTNTLQYNPASYEQYQPCYIEVYGEFQEFGFQSINYVQQEGGKGVIYEMIDEHNNRAPYDFKGIQFKRYDYEPSFNGISIEYITKMNTNKVIEGQIVVPTDKYVWCYLCNGGNSNDEIDEFNNLGCDSSANKYTGYHIPSNYYISECYTGGIIGPLRYLPNIVIMVGDSIIQAPVQCGLNCHDITLYSAALYENIIIGSDCSNIYLHIPYNSTTIGDSVHDIVIQCTNPTVIGSNCGFFSFSAAAGLNYVQGLQDSDKWKHYEIPTNPLVYIHGNTIWSPEFTAIE